MNIKEIQSDLVEAKTVLEAFLSNEDNSKTLAQFISKINHHLNIKKM